MSVRLHLAVACVLMLALPGSAAPASAASTGIPSPRDYWIYAGNYTSVVAGGIYVLKYHSDTGAVEAGRVATGRLWNQGELRGSLVRITAQARAQWPNLPRIVLGVQNPAFLAVHQNGRYLYSADDNVNGTVSAFQIDPATGMLTMLSKTSSGGKFACYATIDQTGKHLLVANFDGSVAVLPIDSSGTLKEATSVVHFVGAVPGREPQSHAHSIVLSPDNRFAIATDMGLARILVFAFDATNGTLTATGEPALQMKPESGSRHLSFHPNGRFVYLISEMGSTISALHWNASHGSLTPLQTVPTVPFDYKGSNATADLAVHPNGRFLYGTNRGHDSIVAYAIDPESGRLSFVEHRSSQGGRPRGLRLDPSGNYLFVANVEGHNIVQFQVDARTGRLTPRGQWKAGAPTSIRFVPIR